MNHDVGGTPMPDPLAFFLTWTTYGSWLPGDERGWAEKAGRFREPDTERRSTARQLMTETELTLESDQRQIVETTIADHCRIRPMGTACRELSHSARARRRRRSKP